MKDNEYGLIYVDRNSGLQTEREELTDRTTGYNNNTAKMMAKLSTYC